MESIRRWLGATWQFVMDAFHPPGRKWLARVWTGVGVIGLVAPSILAGISSASRVIWIVVAVGALAALFLCQGARLQRGEVERKKPTFVCSCSVELVGASIRIRQETFHPNVLFWVRVENQGPAADFSARLLRFNGLPTKDAYEVREAGWERTVDRTLNLTRGGIGRLSIGFLSVSSRLLWFYAARSAMWSEHSDRHDASGRFEIEHGQVTFEIEIVNEKADSVHVVPATIDISSDSVAFTIAGWPKQSVALPPIPAKGIAGVAGVGGATGPTDPAFPIGPTGATGAAGLDWNNR